MEKEKKKGGKEKGKKNGWKRKGKWLKKEKEGKQQEKGRQRVPVHSKAWSAKLGWFGSHSHTAGVAQPQERLFLSRD